MSSPTPMKNTWATPARKAQGRSRRQKRTVTLLIMGVSGGGTALLCPHRTNPAWRGPLSVWLAFCLIAALLLAACIPVARPSVKIGLVGPFEGRYRDTGYAVIYGVRLAVREANQRGLNGYGLELMSLDDSGDADMATTQARKLATDPQIVGAVGHWLDETTVAAAPVYAGEGLPLLATTASPQLDSAAFRLWPTQTSLDALVQPAWQRSTQPFQPGWGQTPLWSEGQSRLYLLSPAPMPADSRTR